MTNNLKSNLPKVISKANKNMSNIIANDIVKESALLKELVDKVLKANLDVKKKNNLRITDTKRKLSQLDDEIDVLNLKIDLVDRETVIEQLNEMIEAENRIFNARQEIRFFDNEQLPKRIDTLNEIYQELSSSLVILNEDEKTYRNTLLNGNDLLLTKQLEVTKEIIKLMDQNFTAKQEFIQHSLSNLYSVREIVINKEKELSTLLNTSIEQYQDLILESSSTFSEVDSNEQDIIRIKEEHTKIIKDLESDKIRINTDYKNTKKLILDEYSDYESSIQETFESTNKSVLEQEKILEEKKAKELKQIRFAIMNAEKTGNYKKMKKFMKDFEKAEKQQVTKVSNKVQKDTASATKKYRQKTNAKLTKNEIKYETDSHNNDYEKAFEVIRYEETKILHKIQDDHKGLQTDVTINAKRIDNLKQFLHDHLELTKVINAHKLELRLSELDMLQNNEYSELDLITAFKSLLNAIKVVETKRNAILQQGKNASQLIKIEQSYQLKKTIEDVRLDQEINDIDKLILRKRNETYIKNEKLIEELNSDVIYQESLINIAQKERELQLIKVNGLFESERSIAEDQVDRINLGVKVNDTFVKTTLQNQLLFANQQIECAKSEFEIRVESVNLTHDQEVQYANKKIEYYRQKFEYNKSIYRKELDDKLEDLNYKLLLFTDEKDNKEIMGKIQNLKDHYEGKIDEIEVVESNDEEIIRYEKVIRDADNRAEAAINEAQELREQTIDSFTSLYDMTKHKFDSIEEPDETEYTKGPHPKAANSAVTKADERLKLAVKEANALYKERTDKPIRIVQETKFRMEELTNSDESTRFINEQKELKKEKYHAHKVILDQLLNDKEVKTLPIQQEYQQLELSKNATSVNEDFNFDKEDYRTKIDIDFDYTALIKKETEFHNQMILNLQSENSVKNQSFDLILKETNEMIKKTSIPYRLYLKKASKDITSKKKALKKLYDKNLRRRLSETDKRIKDEIIL